MKIKLNLLLSLMLFCFIFVADASAQQKTPDALLPEIKITGIYLDNGTDKINLLSDELETTIYLDPQTTGKSRKDCIFVKIKITLVKLDEKEN